MRFVHGKEIITNRSAVRETKNFESLALRGFFKLKEKEIPTRRTRLQSPNKQTLHPHLITTSPAFEEGSKLATVASNPIALAT